LKIRNGKTFNAPRRRGLIDIGNRTFTIHDSGSLRPIYNI